MVLVKRLFLQPPKLRVPLYDPQGEFGTRRRAVTAEYTGFGVDDGAFFSHRKGVLRTGIDAGPAFFANKIVDDQVFAV